MMCFHECDDGRVARVGVGAKLYDHPQAAGWGGGIAGGPPVDRHRAGAVRAAGAHPGGGGISLDGCTQRL